MNNLPKDFTFLKRRVPYQRHFLYHDSRLKLFFRSIVTCRKYSLQLADVIIPTNLAALFQQGEYKKLSVHGDVFDAQKIVRCAVCTIYLVLTFLLAYRPSKYL